MARVNNLSDFLADVADAIRTKKETTEQIPAEQFDQEILSIESGIDTSDATATADNLEIDKTAYVNNTKITGTLGKLMAINRTARDVATVNENLNMTALIRNLNTAYFPTVGQLDNNAYQMIFSIDGAYYMVTSSKQCNYQDYSSYEVLWNGGSLKAYKLINGTWVQSNIPNITFERNNSVVRIDNVRFVSIIAGSNYSIMYTENLSSVFYSQNTDLQPKNSIVTPDTALSISATNSDVANTIGLTADKLVKGNTVLGIEGTAETGVMTEEEYNNCLAMSQNIVGENDWKNYYIKKYNLEIPQNVIDWIANNYDLNTYNYWIDYWQNDKTYDIWLYNKINYTDLKCYMTNINSGVATLYFNITNFNCTQIKLNYSDLSVKSNNDTKIATSIYINRINNSADNVLPYVSCIDTYTDNTYSDILIPRMIGG